MRDPQFNCISVEEKPINNEYTKKGRYALIEICDDSTFPDAKIRGKQKLYANIIKIGDDLVDLQFYISKNESYHIIETRNLEPQEQPVKVKRRLDKLNKFHSQK